MLRLVNLLVKGGYFVTVNIVFLIKGHAKNTCDRTFNLMKKGHRKKQACAKEQALTVLGTHDDVTIINATSSMFHECNSWQNQFCRKYPSGVVTKSHVFVVNKLQLTSVQLQTAINSNEVVVCDLMKGARTKPVRMIVSVPDYVKANLPEERLEDDDFVEEVELLSARSRPAAPPPPLQPPQPPATLRLVDNEHVEPPARLRLAGSLCCMPPPPVLQPP